MKLSNFIALPFFVVSLLACNSNKGLSVEDQGEVLIEQYCSEDKYFSDRNNFRGNAIGESSDQMTAKKKARSNAQSELAKSISSTMKIVGDNYVSSSEFNNKEEVTETFNEMSRTVVDEQLQGVITICEKMTKTSQGKYKCYMALEIAAEKLASKYHERLSKDEKLRADYNYEKFKETFEKEMEKMSSGN